MKHWGKDSQWE